MFKFAQLLVAVAIHFSVPALAADPCNRLLMGGVPITQTALEAIHGAQADYDIEVLSKVVDGKPRIVILAGETHVKSERASESGLDLIKQFNFRGLEGGDFEKNGMAGALFSRFLHAVDFIGRRILRLRGSTIDDAQLQEMLEIAKNEYAKRFAAEIKAKAGKNSIIMDESEEAKLRESLASIEGRVKGFSENIKIPGEDLLPLVKKYLAESPTNSNKEQDGPNAPINLRLEEGHVPGWAENLEMAQIPAILGLAGLSLGLSSFGETGNPYLDMTTQVVNVMVYFNMGYGFAKMSLENKFEHTKWFNIVFPLHGGLLNGRNETMVGNIEKGFLENPDSDQMLVIVGSDHVKGMKQLLMDQHGYSASTIPALPTNEPSRTKGSSTGHE